MTRLSPDISTFIAMSYFIGMAIHTERQFIKGWNQTRGLREIDIETIGLIVGERLKVRGKERETIGLIERERGQKPKVLVKRGINSLAPPPLHPFKYRCPLIRFHVRP